MWRVAKQQRGQLVTAVAHAWDWIHYLVEPDTVDMEVRGHGNDTSCIDAISSALLWCKTILSSIMVQNYPQLYYGAKLS